MDGLWSVAFSGRTGIGHGVVVINGNRILGGDSSFFWTGTLTMQGGRIEARLDARSHTGGPAPTVLGGSQVQFSLQLSAPAPSTTPIGATLTASGPALTAVLTKRA